MIPDTTSMENSRAALEADCSWLPHDPLIGSRLDRIAVAEPFWHTDDHDGESDNEGSEPHLLLSRKAQLHQDWYGFSSNHVLINKERAEKSLRPLTRRSELDAAAKAHAESMARRGRVYRINISGLREKLGLNGVLLDANVAVGRTIEDIHRKMMSRPFSGKTNILDHRYAHFGIGTGKGGSKKLYVCQIFQS